MSNRHSQRGGADTVANHNKDIQERLINLALNDRDGAGEVIANADKFDELYQPTIAAMKFAESQGCLLTRQTHRSYLEVQEKMIPADVAARMTVFNRSSIMVVKRDDLPGLMLSLNAIDGQRRKTNAVEKIKSGEHEQGLNELKAAGVDTAKLETALAAGGKLPLRANIVKASDIVEKPLQWLWQDRIPLGKLTLLFGTGSVGKSMLTVDMAARLSVGREWGDGASSAPGRSLMITAEDDPSDTVVPRLRAAGADLTAVDFLQTVQAVDGNGKRVEKGFTLKDLPQLESAMKSEAYKLIVVDPWGAFLNGTDSHVDAEIRQILSPVSMLAAKYMTAVVFVAHINKGGKGLRAAQRVMGSVGLSNACRAAYLVTEDGKDLERRLMLPTKLNVAKQIGGMAYRVVSSTVIGLDGRPLPIVEWLGNVQTTADDALAATEDMSMGERDGAKTYLRQALDGGAKSATALISDAASRGISERTLKRAKEDLCVVSEKKGSGAWLWSLPQPMGDDERTF